MDDAANLGFDDAAAAFGRGAMDEARALLAELRRLDPADHVGGALLAHVLARHERGGEAGAGESPAAYPVRGWSGVGP